METSSYNSDMKKLLNLRQKCYILEIDELDKIETEFEQEIINDQTGVKAVELALFRLYQSLAFSKVMNILEQERIFQRLVGEEGLDERDTEVPLLLKLEYLRTFHVKFENLEHLSRSESIRNVLKSMHEKNPDDQDIRYSYVFCLATMGFNSFTLKDPSMKTHTDLIKKLISESNFSKEQLAELDFRINIQHYLYYFQVCQENAEQYLKAMMKQIAKSFKIEWSKLISHLILDSSGKDMIDGPEYLKELNYIIGSICKLYNKDLNSYVKFNMKMIEMTLLFSQSPAQACEIASELDAISLPKLIKIESLLFKILVKNTLQSQNTENSSNVDDLSSIMEEFESLINEILANDNPEFYYIFLPTCARVSKSPDGEQEAFNAHTVFDTFNRLKGQDLSLMGFSMNLVHILSPSYTDIFKVRDEILERYGVHKFSKIRTCLTPAVLTFSFDKIPKEKQVEVVQNFEKVIEELRTVQSQYEYIQEQIRDYYYAIMTLMPTVGMIDKLPKYCKEGLELTIKAKIEEKSIFIFYLGSLNCLDQSGHQADCLSYCDKVRECISSIKYASEEELDLLRFILEYQISNRKLDQALKTVILYLRQAEALSSKKSEHYLAGLVRKNYIEFFSMNVPDNYRNLLDTYDLAKEVCGSENNKFCSITLNYMAMTKMRLKQFNDALSFCDKIEEIRKNCDDGAGIEPSVAGVQMVRDQANELKQQQQEKKAKKTKVKHQKVSTQVKIGIFVAFVISAGSLIYAFNRKK